MAPNGRTVWQSAAAVAAALFVAAVALGSPGNSNAQNLPKDHRAQKKAPPRGPVQPLRKGPLAVGPNRVVPPHRAAPGSGALPQGARIAPQVNPAIKGPDRFGHNQPSNRGPGNQIGRAHV